MKKIFLTTFGIIILGITFSYNAFCQSTFNAETLKAAIENYVKQQNPNITKIEIKQTLNPQFFSQKGVIANISHTDNLINRCKITLTFSYNDQILTKLIVNVNAISDNSNNINNNSNTINNKLANNSFKQIQINKGEKVKLLHYSGAICIKTDGIAMESGNTGDIIKVKSDNSQTLYGFIAEDGNIIIEDKNLLVNKGK